RGRRHRAGDYGPSGGDLSAHPQGRRPHAHHVGNHRLERQVRSQDRGRSAIRAPVSSRSGRPTEGDPRRPRAAAFQGDALMTILENAIRIDAPPEKVWSVLASLDQLERYDPGVTKSVIVTPAREGPGSARRCDLKPGGWFKEKVVDFKPNE